MRPTRIAGLITLTLVLAACSKDETPVAAAQAQTPQQERVLRYTAIPDQNSTELQEKFRPLSAYLTKQLGVRVEYVPVRDYQAAVEAFKNGDVLLAWFGGLTGVQA